MSDNPPLPAAPTSAPLNVAEVMALQQELEAIQTESAGGTISADRIRRGIDIVRLLRRTNTGPSSTRGRKAAKAPAFDPLALLNQPLPKT